MSCARLKFRYVGRIAQVLCDETYHVWWVGWGVYHTILTQFACGRDEHVRRQCSSFLGMVILPGLVAASLPFRCVSEQQEHDSQRAARLSPVLETSALKPCRTLFKHVATARKMAYRDYESWKNHRKERTAETNLTMSLSRLSDNAVYIVEEILENQVPGGIMETGVWTGFMSMVMAATLKVHSINDRIQYMCDSFTGLPPPDASRFPGDKGSGFHKLGRHNIGVSSTQERFRKNGLLEASRQRWEVGFFNNTMPGLRQRVDKLAVLRLDGDMYQSTWEVLLAMYPTLQVGGFLMTDDYDLPPFIKAIKDFRARYGIKEEMHFPKRPVLTGKVHLKQQGMYWKVERRVNIPLQDVVNTFSHARDLVMASSS